MSVKRKITILVSACLVVLVGAIIADKIMSKSYFTEIKYDELIEKIENDESFVFVMSQTTCNHCASYKPKVEKIANKYKLDIYYIEVDLLDDKQSDELKAYVNFDSTPVTVFIKEGEETSAITRINGNASSEKIENKLKSNGFIE